MEVPVRYGMTIICAIAATACAGEGASGGAASWRAVADTVADTITVRTVSGSVWGDTATLVEEVRIGTMEGADEYIIGDARSIAVGNEGRIYLLDRQVPVVRAYSADGTYLFDAGREGGGPGEYERPDGMNTLPDGRVVVRDPGASRVVVFSADGEFLEQWSRTKGGGFNTSRRFYADTAGYSYWMILLEAGLPPWEWSYGLMPISPTGEQQDTLVAPTWDFDPAQVTASREGSSSFRSVPFTPGVEWTFSPLGYFVGGLSTDYRIDLFHRDGTVLRIEREWTPVPVQDAEAEERRINIRQGMQRQYGSWRWNGPEIPDTKPPFNDLWVDYDGRIWVQVPTEARPTMTEAEALEEERRTERRPLRLMERPAYDVFASDGTYLGHVITPAEFQDSPDPLARGDTVWAVVRDDLDVPSIVRFRMVR
jgi:hypothetical protein